MISVLGLAVGFACCTYIVAFVIDDLSYDKHFSQPEQLYRISGSYDQGGDTRNISALTTYLLFPALEGIRGIQSASRLEPFSALVRYEENVFHENQLIGVDSGFFELFDMQVLHGEAPYLNQPNQVVLTRSAALKTFGFVEDVIGRQILLDDINVTVVSVIEDMPENQHFHGDFIVSMRTRIPTYPRWILTNNSGTSHYTYIRTEPDISATEIEEQLAALVEVAYENDQSPPEFFLQPVSSIHLYSNLTNEIEANSNYRYIYFLAVIALVVLSVATINYINLSTAKSMERLKEVGVRKAMGAHRKQLQFQFLLETVLVSVIAGILSGLMLELALPKLAEISGKNIPSGLVTQPTYILGILFGSGLIGVLAGLYPAHALASRDGTASLTESHQRRTESRGHVRKTLVFLQFSASFILIVSTLFIYRQLQFLREHDLGIDPNWLVSVPLQTAEIAGKYETIKTDLLSLPAVTAVSASNKNFSNRIGGWRPYTLAGREESVLIPTVIVEFDYFETLSASFADGRDFSRDFGTDPDGAYIINQSAVDFLELDEPIGHEITGSIFTGSVWGRKEATIIGVVEDFHFASLHSEIQPAIFSLRTEGTMGLNWLAVRIASSDVQETMGELSDIWSKYAGDRPFIYSFLDEDIYAHYSKEEAFLELFTGFAMLAIIIACIGIVGLSSFMVNRKFKEIGIRKALGASAQSILWMLSQQYMRMIVISGLVCVPVAWYLIGNWLDTFPYHVEQNLMLYFLGLLLVLILALSAVSIQSAKAALMNPCDALKEE